MTSTPAVPLAPRIGACGAQPRCAKGCDSFARGESISYFITCQCSHTQQVHARVEATA
jgi:hypothetical protein